MADVFDALTSKRPYRDAFPLEKALQAIAQGAGSHFDPKLAKAFTHVSLPRLAEVHDRIRPSVD